jgi:putative transcriptional regulator
MISNDPRRPDAPTITAPLKGALNVRKIRLGIGGGIAGTQKAFAQAIGVPVKTLRNWEQKRREPSGPARVLLMLVARDPWLVFDVANDQHRTSGQERADQNGNCEP